MKTIITTINKELAAEIGETGDQLLKILDLFTAGQINTIPFEGSWTAGQVIDHILKSGSGMYEVIHGHCGVPGRPFNEKEKEIRELFLNFDIKFQSPLEIRPTQSPLQKEQLQHNVQHLLSKIKQAALTLNPEEACLDHEFPGSGTLTRYEWLSFFVVHTIRHTRQLKNISDVLGKA
jgi:uncharacterized damage-inducible protein DinB